LCCVKRKPLSERILTVITQDAVAILTAINLFNCRLPHLKFENPLR